MQRRASRYSGVFRSATSLSLVVAATLLLVPSILANWARIQIYDTDTFSNSAVAALREEPVRDALVRAIVDEIVRDGSSEAISLRPLIEFVTATVVDTQAFRDIYRDAVDNLHNDMLRRPSESDPVALTLVDAVIVITAYLQQAYPEVAENLPANLSNAFIEIRSRDWTVQIVALGDDVAFLALALPLIMLVLYGGALLLSQNRGQTLMMMGLGWIAVAALLVIGRDSAREFVLGGGFPDQAVSEAIWDVYTRSLLGWAALVGAIGLMVTVAATGAHRSAGPAQQLDMARRALSYVPASQWGKIARAAAFVLVGLLVIVQREHVLTLSVLMIAAYLMYYGLTELVWITSSGTIEAAPPAERAPSRWRQPMAIRAGAISALLAIAAGGYFYVEQAVDTAGGETLPPPVATRCNGYEALCDRRLDEVVFLGTHNSMSAATERGWYFANHFSGIRSQLGAGVRALMIDTYYGYDTGRGVRTADRDFVAEALPPDEYSEEVIDAAKRLAAVIGGVDASDVRGTYLCHTFCELGAKPLSEALSEINDFLERNPGEVVILVIQDQISPEDTAKAFIVSGLIKRVHQLIEGEPVPTLRELIEKDQRVLVFAENNSAGVDWYMQAFDFLQDTPYQVESPSQFTCDLGRGEPGNPIFVLNHWVSSNIPSMTTAREINDYAFLHPRAQSCELLRDRKVNVIAVNFYEVGDAPEVVNILNGVAEPPTVTR